MSSGQHRIPVPYVLGTTFLLVPVTRFGTKFPEHGTCPGSAFQAAKHSLRRAQQLDEFVPMAVAISTSPCSVSGHLGVRPTSQAPRHLRRIAERCGHRKLTVLAAAGKPPGEAEEQIPVWAKPGALEPPPWERKGGAVQGQEAGQVPFYTYLLASAVTAIAAIGSNSIFEYTNQRPVFGIIDSDSALYVPLLGFFVFTGIPTSAFLWFKAVQTANREAEEQDRRDGFL